MWNSETALGKLFEPQGRTDYYWSYDIVSHELRRKAMLKKYGKEIKKLFGPEPWLAVFMTPAILLQLYLGLRACEMSWPVYLFVAYFIGGTISHSSFLAIHETTHDLVFKTRVFNDYYALFLNSIVPIPYAMMFKSYHADHHHYLGWEYVDTDVPTPLEAKLLSSYFGKFLFLTCQVFFYVLRPCIIWRVQVEKIHFINYAVQILFNIIIYRFFGLSPLIYFLVSIILGTGWHPLAGHFISEHYVFKGDGKQETFSYYGPLNWLTWMAGYHVEHHDFPNIAWVHISKLHAIAPEFYNDLYVTESWPGTLYDFLFDKKVNQLSRVVREKGASKRAKLLPTKVKTGAAE
ncbi:putative fatty acid desaturase, putative,sphingolipid delta 4 desaturase [Trypanosoma conorhini]|uniref:sphingolipid 4-desaturase n=1 Tax=Trypanosoma conorhini TaxID=83891 RepID=A0A3R7P2C8_9TRYP|nr:putative fatty acid desaturase, putative,sphingolipid delta 4 desaturase [Trypanosoma conorhini]RNF11656.1 putative fatty acid desaturase, putative,sphingolipid delta 4 desaturase [Trypanosoma conorhini]